MALQASDGRYLRVFMVVFNGDSISDIQYKLYQNMAHRQNGDTDLLKAFQGSVNSGALQTEFDKLADSALSINDNIKKAAYSAIKADTFEFSNWADA